MEKIIELINFENNVAIYSEWNRLINTKMK